MAEGFTSRQLLPGVIHIADPLGVHATLLTGKRSALLFDAGYGIYDLCVYVRGLTRLPVTLLLSHGHHDHALGAMHFSEALILPEDLRVLQTYTSEDMRERAAKRTALTPEAAQKYMQAPMPRLKAPEGESFELGGLCARLLRMPGHTPGSAALYVPQLRLLLTGDNWNPVTWLFFAEALPAEAYAASMRSVLALPFAWALTPHHGRLIRRALLERYIRGLTREVFSNALPIRIPDYEDIPTKEVFPAPGFKLVFRA